MSEVTDNFSGVNNIKVTSSKARHLHECEVRSTALSPHPSPIVFCFNLSSAFPQLYLLTYEPQNNTPKKQLMQAMLDQLLLFSIRKIITVKSTKNYRPVVVYL